MECRDFKGYTFYFMKTISIFIFILTSLISCQPTLVKDSEAETPQIISPFQQILLAEINLARSNPAIYADLRLKAYMLDSTDNGSYLYLKHLTPVSSLTFNNSLNISASVYATYLAENNLMGHDLDGTPLKRAITVGFTGSSIGENIAASTGDSYNSLIQPDTAAIYFVELMIIDAGVTDLGHRLTMLSPDYKTVGIGYSRNPLSTYINYNVQDFGNK